MKTIATKSDTKTQCRPDTKSVLLEAGSRLMLEKGYTNTGIQEIVNLSKVPKGSFYHYFESKEAFALGVIEKIDQNQRATLRQRLMDSTLSPVKRLSNHFALSAADMTAAPCRGGCLIGNLSQEMSSQSEMLRGRLAACLDGWKAEYAACIKEGQEQGEVRRDLCPMQLAEIVLSGWEGAVLRSKATNSTGPVEAFQNLLPKLIGPGAQDKESCDDMEDKDDK